MLPPIFPVPTWALHSYYNIIDCIPCAVPDIPVTTDLYSLIPSPLSPHLPTPLPSGSHQPPPRIWVWFNVVCSFLLFHHSFLRVQFDSGKYRVGQKWVSICEFVKHGEFLYYYLLIIALFSIRATVNLLLPHPVCSLNGMELQPFPSCRSQTLSPWNRNSLFPSPSQPLATALLRSVSMNSTTLWIQCKWNPTVSILLWLV